MKTKISIKDSKVFVSCMTKISKIVNEGKLTFNDKGVKMIAMDPANVAMVIFDMDKANFTEYVNEGENQYGIKFNDFITMLKRVKSDLTIEIDKQITLTCKGKKFTMPIIEIDETDRNVPELDFKVKLDIPADNFKDALEDCALADDSGGVVFDVKKTGEFILLTKGKIDANVEIKPVNHKVQENIQTIFSIEYLKNFVNKTLSETLTLEFSKDYPLKLKDDKVTYILAPRVSEP